MTDMNDNILVDSFNSHLYPCIVSVVEKCYLFADGVPAIRIKLHDSLCIMGKLFFSMLFHIMCGHKICIMQL